jgi:hypothetical protein
LTACLAGAFYSGDGHLTDHGPAAFDQRYTLDLGPIDLRKTGKIQYHVGKLPDVRFKVGVDIHFVQPLAEDDMPLSAIVAIAVLDSAGRTVFSDERPLKDWRWARTRSTEDLYHVFVWLDPHRSSVLSSPGEYILTFAVVLPDTGTRDYAARLTMKGGEEGY